MKRVGNIYANMYDKNNIRQAILKAAAGKRNRKKVTKIIENIDFYINDIYQMLISKDVKLSPYKKMKIHDGARKKERIIYKPAFYPDQCIHWCVMIQLQPLLEKGMYEYCCASVPKRGIHYGSKYLKRILKDDKKNTKYCLKLDVKKFYPSIDKFCMKKKFRAIIKDYDMLDLIDKIIDSSDSGLPIRQFYISMVCKFLSSRFRSLYKRKIKDKILFALHG